MSVESQMLPLGTEAPDFALPDVVTGDTVKLADVADARALLVMFICRHCPYVRHVRAGIAQLGRDHVDTGLAIVGISPNDPEEYPEDAPESLAEDAREAGYTFPYLFDETQEVAKAYGAVCTPDFFGYNAKLQLQYRGRLDDSGRSPKPNAPRELFDAMVQVARTGQGPREQTASIGCSIKWRG